MQSPPKSSGDCHHQSHEPSVVFLRLAYPIAVFALLVVKPGRLTGAEVRFIRKHLRMRQADLASTLNMANHSVVSQW